MEMDPQSKEDRGRSILKLKIVELERKLREENERSNLFQSETELAMLVASQEIDKYKRECVLLKETVSRLEEDRDILRKREHRDAQTIRNLLGKIERHEREFSDKLAELTMRNWDLECTLNAKGDGYGEMEKGISELVKEENCRVVEKEEEFQDGNVDEQQSSDEMPKRTSVQKRDFVVVDSDSVSDDDDDGIPLSDSDDDDDEIPLSLLSKKRALDTGSSSNHSFDRMAPYKFGSIGAKEISAAVVTMKDTKEMSAKGVQAKPKRNVKNQNSQIEHTGRIASFEQKTCAVNRAKLVQMNLMSHNPSCWKQMAQSHVSGSFWLSLPREFCKENLPADEHKMILEDEKGVEYDVKYIGNQTALSAGWRGFALAHSLELHDVLIFQLCEPSRFKVYIIKAVMEFTEDVDDKIAGEYTDGTRKMANSTGYGNQDVDLSNFN